MSATANPPRVGFVSLGCPKALVDSERILTQLRAEGYEISPTYDGADVVVVNTCGFIDSAVEESLEAIGRLPRPCTCAGRTTAFRRPGRARTGRRSPAEWVLPAGFSG